MHFQAQAQFSPDGRWLIQNDGSSGEIVVEDLATWKVAARFKTRGGTSRTAFAAGPGVVVTNSAFRLNEATVTRLRLDGPSPNEAKQIADALVRLDADDVAVRERAQKDLLALGPVAEPSLRKSMKDSSSAEVRLQARKLREKILATPAATFELPTETVTALALSPDGTRLAVGDSTGTIYLVGVPDGKTISQITTTSR
jgi:WD40 repeat protein